MSSPLNGKNILLGVTGGIAAFKAATLVRLLVKAGAQVKVIMTPAAKEFITPLTLATLSRNAVISEFFTANTGQWNSHVDLGLWAHCMIVAPATACTIAKMSSGVADNMLVTSYLSARSQVFVAPAMDLDMMNHPTTVENLERLRSFGNIVIEPGRGELASGLVGKGRMAEPEEIVARVEQFFACSDALAGKHVLVTAGPTFEKIDPVRFIGNYSSGKMGYALAEAAAAMGAQVTLVSGPVDLAVGNPSINLVKVESAIEMLEAAQKAFETAHIAVMAAAVADFRPSQTAHTKIKRQGLDQMTLQLTKNPDIAATLAAAKRPEQIVVGFALETDNELGNAIKKLQSKHLDFIVLNSLRDTGAGFGTDTNKVTVIDTCGNQTQLPLMTKKELAFKLLEIIGADRC